MHTEPNHQLMLNQSLQSYDQRGEPIHKHQISDRFSLNFSDQDSHFKGLNEQRMDPRTQTMAMPGSQPLNNSRFTHQHDYVVSNQGRVNPVAGQHRQSSGA